MLVVEVTEFIPPNGKTRDLSVPVPDDLTEKYTAMRSLGLRLTVERLMTGLTSLCIENPEYGDFKTKLFPNRDPEGPDNIDPLIDIIREFDTDEYRTWYAMMEMQERQAELDDGDIDYE